MAGPSSPGSDGPSFAPPPLPAGWIAQWDASSKQYYYVQLSTGASQWQTPTDPAPVGTDTPSAHVEHPYGVPGQGKPAGSNDPQIIVHPDGSQTARYPDGRVEPVNPREDGSTADGTRGVGGASGDRSLGSLLGGALNSIGGNKPHGGGSGGGVGGLAGHVVTGLLSSGHSSSHGGGHGGGSGGIGGKIASQLASNLFSGHKPSSQPQNFHGGQSSGHSSGGGLGGLVGGVASMLGGGKTHNQNNFGYSNTGQTGGYSAAAPPASYQPPSQPGQPTTTPSYHSSTPSYQPPGQHQAAHTSYGHSTPSSQPYTPSYGGTPGSQVPPPPHGQGYPAAGQTPQAYVQQSYGSAPQQQTYGAPPPIPAPYGQHGQHGQPQYGQPPPPPGPAPGGHSPYPPQPQYASPGHHHQQQQQQYGAGQYR